MGIIFLCIVLLSVCINQNKDKYEIEDSIFKSFIICSLLIVASVEIFSLFSILNYKSLLIFWLIILFATALTAFKLTKLELSFKPFRFKIHFNIIYILIVAGILVISGMYTFPNNWDSMVYHLARIPNWIQQASVNHYATDITRAISQNPFAEYFILNLAILSVHNAHSLFLVQFLSYLLCILSSSYLVKVLKGTKETQVFAATLTAFLPMALLQSTTAQNDLVAALFLILSCIYLFKLKTKFNSFDNHLYFGATVGLLVLTKGTAYIYLVPLAVYYMFLFLTKFQFNRIKYPCAIIGLLIGLNGPHWLRNYNTFGTILGPNYGLIINKKHLECFGSNLYNNAALQVQTPFIKPKAITNVLVKAQQKLKLDDADCRWAASPDLDFVQFRYNEDYISNPFHFILFIFCFLFYLVKIRDRHSSKILLFIIIGMLLTFCFLLKWQVWHPRLHVPIFVLSNVFMAQVITNVLSRKIISFLFFLFAIQVLFNNNLKPLNDPAFIFSNSKEQAFIIRKELNTTFKEIEPFIKQVDKIALVNKATSWEYPFWYFFNQNFEKEIRSIMVENETKKYEHLTFHPDVIISQKGKYNTKEELVYYNSRYQKIYNRNGIAIFTNKTK